MPRGDANSSESNGTAGQFVASEPEATAVAARYGYRRIENHPAASDAVVASDAEASALLARYGHRRIENHPAVASDAEASAVAARDCSPREVDGFVVSDLSPVFASIEVSQAQYGCADEVGLAPASDHAAIATLVTRGVRGPLLLMGSWFGAALVEEVRRLDPERVVVAGVDEGVIRRRLPEVEITPIAADEATDEAAAEAAEAAEGAEGASFGRVWLVDGTVQAEPLAAVAQQIAVAVISVPGDLRELAPPARVAIAGASEVEMLSDLGEDARWQLDVVRRGDELPGGGLVMFDSAASPGRRLVAVYGHPSTPVLGVLGEQSPQAGIERLRSIAEGYDADGSTVVPTFEVIATVASASAGKDGDYSGVTARDVIRPWIEAAAANGAYVVLDLQPGRSDFLSQARIYEEFLRLPHVGLALDPEWRLEPHQVHLRQIGSVDAAEINQVVEWLADLVRSEALPQKLLVLHQFRFSMITNRDRIQTPPELAVVIHMDGQGALAAKYNTWNTLTGPHDAGRFYWGWKNFYDEDSPVATADQVLDLSPAPVFVSFQ